jgi:hypothetical protein
MLGQFVHCFQVCERSMAVCPCRDCPSKYITSGLEFRPVDAVVLALCQTSGNPVDLHLVLRCYGPRSKLGGFRRPRVGS